MKKPDTRKAPMSAVSDYIEILEKKIIELNNELEKYRKGHLAPEIHLRCKIQFAQALILSPFQSLKFSLQYQYENHQQKINNPM